MLQDVLFGLKLLFKQRAFTAAALITLALSIGANTAILTVLENVVLRGLPFPQAERLVAMYNVYPGVGVTDRGKYEVAPAWRTPGIADSRASRSAEEFRVRASSP
jgi:hypothetical protein